MKRRTVYIFTVLLAIILIIVEAYVVKVATKIEPEIEVIFASKKIPARTIITADMVTVKKIDVSLATLQTARNINEVIGKAATSEIESGEIIKTFRIADPLSLKEIKVLNPENRLMSVEFKPDQVNGWHLAAGDIVDIHYTPDAAANLNIDRRDSISDPFQKSLLDFHVFENVRIAGILDDKGQVIHEVTKEQLPKIISFEVSKDLAKFLGAAKHSGKIEISVVQTVDTDVFYDE